MNRIDFKQISFKPHLVRLLFLFFASIYLVVALLLRFQSQSSFERIQKQTQQRQEINHGSAASLAIFKDYAPLYHHYFDQSLVGASNRLDWIQTLDQLARSIGVPDMHFSLDKTRLSKEGDTPFFHFEIPIYITDMNLDLKLLHEGDLYRFLTAYAEQSKGTFSVESCEIARASFDRESSQLERLHAKCKLRWFNLKDIRENWQEDSANATM